MGAKQVVELSIRDFTQSEHLDSRHSIQNVWASVYPLISSTCSVRTDTDRTRSWINITDIAQMKYLLVWTADVYFKVKDSRYSV